MFVRFALIPVYDNLTFYHIPVDSLLGIKEEAGIRPASSFVRFQISNARTTVFGYLMVEIFTAQ